MELGLLPEGKNRLKILGNGVLRNTLELKRRQVKGGWREWHNEREGS
jgi:hypothetical protein